MARVLVVDDQLAMAEMLADGLADHGIEAKATASGRDALALLEKERFDVLVTDLRMPDVDGLALLEASRRLDPERPVMVMTAYGAIDTAIESVRRGAFHYLTKPFKLEELVLFVRRAIDQVRLKREAAELRASARSGAKEPFVAAGKRMREVLETVERLARVDTPVLLLGETGTGKGRIARALHAMGVRASRPFVTVNCAAIPESLLESELFGHVKGAFTGATSPRAGLFLDADGGTLFLDEIGDMPLSLQAKLLHVLEHGAVRPVGGAKEQPFDVRIVAATHRALDALVKAGEFRADLLYRLDVVSIEIPPLRERRDDLPALIDAFLKEAKTRHPDAPGARFSREALERLLAAHWPGNVRELAHAIERAVVLSRGETIELADLSPSIARGESGPSEPRGGPEFQEIVPMREMSRRYAAWAYEQLGRHRNRTAEKLEIDPKTLSRLLEERSSG